MSFNRISRNDYYSKYRISKVGRLAAVRKPRDGTDEEKIAENKKRNTKPDDEKGSILDIQL